MKFIRYGSLVPQQHTVDEKERTFHSPPAEYGIYAFPKGYREGFLLSGIGSGNIKNGRYKFFRDSKGNKIKTTRTNLYDYSGQKTEIKEPYNSMFRQAKINPQKIRLYKEDEDGVNDGYFENDEEVYIVVENEPKIFEYNGLIWHHLAEYCGKYLCSHGDIIKSVDDLWYLTDIKTYEKCLKKYTYLRKREEMYPDSKATLAERYKYYPFGSVSGYPLSRFDKDEFEVYIEKVN